MTIPQRIKAVQEVVARHYGRTVSDLTSANRSQRNAHPRRMAMAACRLLIATDDRTIAIAFNRERSLVSWAIETLRDLACVDPRVRQDIADVLREAAKIIYPGTKDEVLALAGCLGSGLNQKPQEDAIVCEKKAIATEKHRTARVTCRQ